MRVGFVAVLAVLVSGCAIGAGPTFGYRHGKGTVGWEGGPSLLYLGEPATFIRANVGQSYRGGIPFTYGTLGADLLLAEGQHEVGGAGGAIGGGRARDTGASPVLGADAFLFTVKDLTGGCAGFLWLATLSVGVRWLGGHAEVFAAPRVDLLGVPCLD